MDDAVMLAHAALAADFRDAKRVNPMRFYAGLKAACLDLAHGNTLVAFSASDVLETFFDPQNTIRGSSQDTLFDVVDLLLDVARGECASREDRKRKRVRLVVQSVPRAAARAASILRGALKRETAIVVREVRKVLTSSSNYSPQTRTAGIVTNCVSLKLDDVMRRAAATPVPERLAGTDTSYHDAVFLWKAAALRLAVAARASVVFGDEKKKRVDAATTSRAVVDLTAQAFSWSHGTPGYYKHASFVALEKLFKSPPKETLDALAAAGALRLPRTETETDGGPFSESTQHNTSSSFRRAWLLFFKAGRFADLPSDPHTMQFLVNVFVGEDDRLVDFLECVLQFAEKREDAERPTNEDFHVPSPSQTFLALCVELSWDCDTVFALLLSEKGAVVLLGYFAAARVFVQEWDVRDALRFKAFEEKLLEKVSATLEARLDQNTNSLLQYVADALRRVIG